MNKKLAAIALSAGLLTGGAAGLLLTVPGVSGAATSTTEVPTTDSTTDITGRDAQRGQWVTDALATLVADGTITQAQADAVQAALEAARPERPEGDMGGRGGRGGRGPGLEAAATALGMTADELRTELQSGDSIADVAGEKGVAVQTVIDALVAEAKTHLAEEVASGEHTQAEADAKLADITERITAMVNGEMPTGGPRGGHRGQADDATTSTTTA